MKNQRASCCGDDCCVEQPSAAADADGVREAVREGYAQIARSGQYSSEGASACGGGGGCCGSGALSPEQVALGVGYGAGELGSIPEGANMGLSCGNPTALASLSAGEVVVDLGSGGGLDCFIAGPKVGRRGRVIGVDMTPDMVTKARRALPAYEARSGLRNVEFRLGEIEHLPLADASVDVVISNCVINLSPDKSQVWREIARVLKPGGRVAVSDLVLLRALPEAVRGDLDALVGCVAGACLLDEVRAHAAEAGISEVEIELKPEYVCSLESVQDPLYRRMQEHLPAGTKLGDFVSSANVTGVKAGA